MILICKKNLLERKKRIYESSKLMINHIKVKSKDIKRSKNIYQTKSKKQYYYIDNFKDNLEFNGKTLNYIAREIKIYSLLKVRKVLPVDLVLNFGYLKFADKNTYLLLDLILYSVVKNIKKSEQIIILNKFAYSNTKNDSENSSNMLKYFLNTGIMNTAFFNSLIRRTEKGIYVGDVVNRKVFLEFYEKNSLENPIYYRALTNNDPSKNKPAFYRKIITKGEFTPKIESVIATDILTILGFYFKDDDWTWEVVEVILEAISNAEKHNNNFILIDIDISDNIKHSQIKGLYEGVNISILNIGEKLLYEKIKKHVLNKDFDKNVSIYKNVYKAYENHKRLFDENYIENMFFMITAFQYRMTTRYVKTQENDDGEYSGTGLPQMIKNIKEKTFDDISYIISDNIFLTFHEEFLNFDKEKLIGFNKECDYLHKKPDKNVIGNCLYKIPGTIYQLHLVKEKGV